MFIRGGEPTQNLVMLDGMQVFQPFHIVGFFSAFPSDIINTADVYAGGYGGKYGGRLSSVIDITARTGNKRRLVGALTAAPFVSSIRLEGPLLPGKISFLASPFLLNLWKQKHEGPVRKVGAGDEVIDAVDDHRPHHVE